MSDIKIKDQPPLEQLKAKIEKEFSHASQAETVEELLVDLERVSRFLVIPPNFIRMVRDIAASIKKHGAESLYVSLKLQRMDPAWAELIAELDELVDFEYLKAGLTELSGYPFKSRTFPTLLREVARSKRIVKIPNEFIDKLGEVVERQNAREIEERKRAAEAEMMARFEGADPDFTRRLVAFAKGEGLSVDEFDDLDGLMERLRRLANVHFEIANKLEPFEAGLRGEEHGPEVKTASNPEVIEGGDKEEPAGSGDRKPVEKDEPVPIYVTTFSSMKGIEWMDGERSGSMLSSGDVLTMSAYGYAIFGTKKTVNFGVPTDPGMMAFLLTDPASGLVSVGKFPYISSMEEALARIAAKLRITKMALNRDPEEVPAHTRRTPRFRTIEMLRSSVSPHEVELKKIKKQIKKLELQAENVVAGAAFFSGRPGNKEFGAPPAQVITMLGAFRSIGIGSVRIGMYCCPERGSSELIYGAEQGVLRVGRKMLLDLNKNGAVDADEILAFSSATVEELENLGADWKFVETIETYHLPLAIGLWCDSLAQLKRKLRGVIATASKKEGAAREKYLLNTYKKWHSMLPKDLNGSKGSMKVSSGKGGGRSSIRGIVRNRMPSRTEAPEALLTLHHEGDYVALSAITSTALNMGALPIIARAGAVVI